MALKLPKCVAIQNRRLEVLHGFMMLCALAVVAYELIITQSWSEPVPFAENLGLEAWLEFNTTSTANQADMWRQPHCSSPQQYDYWWDENWKYTNHSCLPMCLAGNNVVPAPCMRSRDYFINNPSQHLYMIVSSIKEVLKGNDTMYFTPFANAVVFRFLVKLSVPQYSWFTGSVSADRQTGKRGDSRSDLPIVLLDIRGMPLRTLLPTGGASLLTLEDLFLICGHDEDFLDRPWIENESPNVMPNSSSSKYQAGPAPRLSGVRIQMHVRCFDAQQGKRVTIPEKFLDKPVCYVSAMMDPMKWPFIEKEYILNEKGDHLRRILKGPMLEVAVSGTWRRFSVRALVMAIVATIVLLSLPKQIVRQFATTCLGQLSHVYKAALNQPFSLHAECGSVASKLMAHSVSFIDLADRTGSDGRNGISLDRMVERLEALLQHRGTTLDQEEILHLSKFCFNQVVNGNKSEFLDIGLDGCLDGCSSLFGMGDFQKGRVASDVIDIDNFGVALSKNDGVDLDSIVKLFDADRPKWLGERLFTPNDIWEIVHWPKKNRTSIEREKIATGRLRLSSMEEARRTQFEQSRNIAEKLIVIDEIYEDFLGLQSNQAKLDAEVKLLQSQVRRLSGEVGESSASKESATSQQANSIDSELKRSPQICTPSRDESLRSLSHFVDARVASIDVLLERFPNNLFEARTGSGTPTQTSTAHPPILHDGCECNQTRGSNDGFALKEIHLQDFYQRTAEHIKGLEAWWSGQFTLLKKSCNDRITMLEHAMQAEPLRPIGDLIFSERRISM